MSHLGYHPNIIRSLSFFEIRATYAMQMDLMDGSLYEMLTKQGPEFFQRHRKEISLHVATGLSFLHSLGVAHLDLTPKNILVGVSFLLFRLSSPSNTYLYS